MKNSNPLSIPTALPVIAAPAANEADSLFNVADDQPATRMEAMEFAAELLGCSISSSAFQGNLQGERARRRRTENKRVKNERMRALLAPKRLCYPTYKEGLVAIHRDRPGA